MFVKLKNSKLFLLCAKCQFLNLMCLEPECIFGYFFDSCCGYSQFSAGCSLLGFMNHHRQVYLKGLAWQVFLDHQMLNSEYLIPLNALTF